MNIIIKIRMVWNSWCYGYNTALIVSCYDKEIQWKLEQSAEYHIKELGRLAG
ncbi:hypothetical protein [Paenibacillus sp.]|uniref:hypothetical protein n=1 Tax=Paenibacillus sp. TaxID=58172 RepID=UPI0028114818|nr:hypothetical protein [Paenibacillus sp.]